MANEGQAPAMTEIEKLRAFEAAIREKRQKSFNESKESNIPEAPSGGSWGGGVWDLQAIMQALGAAGPVANQSYLLAEAMRNQASNQNSLLGIDRVNREYQGMLKNALSGGRASEALQQRGLGIENAMKAEQLRQMRMSAPGAVAKEGGFNADRGPGVSLGGDMMMAPGGGSDYLSRLMQKKQRADLERALRQGVRDERRDLEAEKAAQIEADRKAAAFNLVMKGLMKVVGKL